MIHKTFFMVTLGLVFAWIGQADAQDKGVTTLLSGKLTNTSDKEVNVEQLKGKIVGIYFSAHWCPPCRAFTPKLVEFRNGNKDKFEVVFVSSDKSAKEKTAYMAESKMP